MMIKLNPDLCTTTTANPPWSAPYQNQTITTTGTSISANILPLEDIIAKAFDSPLNSDDFKKVIEYVPSKVYGFIFNDGKEIKTICDPSDTFDFDFAFYLAAAKHIWGKELTLEGVINKANELKTIKKWVKRVEKAQKKFAEDIRKENEKEIEEQLKKERHERYVAKKKRRDARKKAEADERLKQTILEAIKESR